MFAVLDKTNLPFAHLPTSLLNQPHLMLDWTVFPPWHAAARQQQATNMPAAQPEEPVGGWDEQEQAQEAALAPAQARPAEPKTINHPEVQRLLQRLEELKSAVYGPGEKRSWQG